MPSTIDMANAVSRSLTWADEYAINQSVNPAAAKIRHRIFRLRRPIGSAIVGINGVPVKMR
jgi:hypothetical protein